MVETGGQLWKRHVDQLLKSQVETQTSVYQDVDLRARNRSTHGYST